MITKEIAQAIASQYANTKVSVEPYFGPCYPVQQTAPTGRIPNPALLSNIDIWDAYSFSGKYNFVAPYMYYKVAEAQVINMSNCTDIPVELRLSYPAGLSPFTLYVDAGFAYILVPRGAVTLGTFENLGVQGSFMNYADETRTRARFLYVSNYAYIGHLQPPYICVGGSQIANDVKKCFSAFVDYTIYGSQINGLCIYQSRNIAFYNTDPQVVTNADLQDLGVYNAFSFYQYEPNQYKTSNYMYNANNMGHWVLGYRFKLHDNYSQTGENLTDVTP